jgi:hypothetical protein
LQVLLSKQEYLVPLYSKRGGKIMDFGAVDVQALLPVRSSQLLEICPRPD